MTPTCSPTRTHTENTSQEVLCPQAHAADNRTDIQAPVPDFSAPTLRIFFSLQRKRCVLLYFSGKREARLPVWIFKESRLHQVPSVQQAPAYGIAAHSFFSLPDCGPLWKSIYEAKACNGCIFSAKGRRNTPEALP